MLFAIVTANSQAECDECYDVRSQDMEAAYMFYNEELDGYAGEREECILANPELEDLCWSDYYNNRSVAEWHLSNSLYNIGVWFAQCVDLYC